MTYVQIQNIFLVDVPTHVNECIAVQSTVGCDFGEVFNCFQCLKHCLHFSMHAYISPGHLGFGVILFCIMKPVMLTWPP